MSHFHFDCFCLATIDLKTSSTAAVAALLDEDDCVADAVVDIVCDTPQHTHLVVMFSFGVKQDEHVHLLCICLPASAFNVSSHLSSDFAETGDGTCLALFDSIGAKLDGDEFSVEAAVDDDKSIKIGSLNL